MASIVFGGFRGSRLASGVAVLLASAFVAGGAPARADTVAGFENEGLIFVGEDEGYEDWIEETGGYEGPADGEWTEEWTEEEWTGEDYLFDYDEQIAWSGLPIDEEGILYMTGDWVKRGPGQDSPAPVPLPGAGLLLLGGIAGLAAVRRRRGA